MAQKEKLENIKEKARHTGDGEKFQHLPNEIFRKRKIKGAKQFNEQRHRMKAKEDNLEDQT